MNTINQTTLHQSRGVERIIEGVATSDGAGVKLSRLLTGKLQHRLDSFLMLDAFGSDNPDDYILLAQVNRKCAYLWIARTR